MFVSTLTYPQWFYALTLLGSPLAPYCCSLSWCWQLVKAPKSNVKVLLRNYIAICVRNSRKAVEGLLEGTKARNAWKLGSGSCEVGRGWQGDPGRWRVESGGKSWEWYVEERGTALKLEKVEQTSQNRRACRNQMTPSTRTLKRCKARHLLFFGWFLLFSTVINLFLMVLQCFQHIFKRIDLFCIFCSISNLKTCSRPKPRRATQTHSFQLRATLCP